MLSHNNFLLGFGVFFSDQTIVSIVHQFTHLLKKHQFGAGEDCNHTQHKKLTRTIGKKHTKKYIDSNQGENCIQFFWNHLSVPCGTVERETMFGSLFPSAKFRNRPVAIR